jgi:hypothetical protein
VDIRLLPQRPGPGKQSVALRNSSSARSAGWQCTRLSMLASPVPWAPAQPQSRRRALTVLACRAASAGRLRSALGQAANSFLERGGDFGGELEDLFPPPGDGGQAGRAGAHPAGALRDRDRRWCCGCYWRCCVGPEAPRPGSCRFACSWKTRSVTTERGEIWYRPTVQPAPMNRPAPPPTIRRQSPARPPNATPSGSCRCHRPRGLSGPAAFVDQAHLSTSHRCRCREQAASPARPVRAE